jgi:predicted ATPase
VDEPELGLHPAAISALSGMVKAAAPGTQVILATQSSRLVDEFKADEVMIVERDEKRPRTLFRRHGKYRSGCSCVGELFAFELERHVDLSLS